MKKPLKVQVAAEVLRQGRPRFTKEHKEEIVSAQLPDGPQSHLHSSNPVSIVSKN